MHVRIAWEIYQHQQRGGSSEGGSKSGGSSSSASNTSASSASASSSKVVPPHSSASAAITGLSTPPTSVATSGPTSASLTADLLRSSASHAFPGLSRPGEVPPHFTAPILSPHAPPPHASPRGPYDPLFLNAAAASHLGNDIPITISNSFHGFPFWNAGVQFSRLGPPLPRYPGFGALGPSFGGLSGLGSSLLGRDLSSLVSLSPGQDQWAR